MRRGSGSGNLLSPSPVGTPGLSSRKSKFGPGKLKAKSSVRVRRKSKLKDLLDNIEKNGEQKDKKDKNSNKLKKKDKKIHGEEEGRGGNSSHSKQDTSGSSDIEIENMSMESL